MRVATRLSLGIVVLGAIALLTASIELPGPVRVREWVEGLGPAAVFVFLAAYSVLTAAPIPRTVFNLAAGLLFGEFLGITVALVATVVSGLFGFLLARWLGGGLVRAQRHRRSVATVNQRLSDGGALAVTSLRLIPVIPFAPLSYCCGVSSLRLRAYLAGTALGSVPGTIAVVVLGDALTGTTPPALVMCYATFAALGALGLLRAVTATRPEIGATPGKTDPG